MRIARFAPLLSLLACQADLPAPIDSGVDGGTTTDDTGVTTEADPSLICAELGLTVRPWVDAEDSTAMYATAADLTIVTRDGDWNLATNHSGCDSYLFIQEDPRQNGGFDQGIWERDQDDLLDLLPKNVHLFFFGDSRDEDTRNASLDALTEALESRYKHLDDDEADWWRAHIHYATKRDTKQEGWLGEMMDSPGWGVAIDRFQRLRYIGSYADPTRYNESVGWFEPNLGMVANEAVYYNYEATREEALDADGATVVQVFGGEESSDVTVDVELPDAATLAGMDTLKVDLTMACIGEGEYGTCPAWDYMAYEYLCDLPEVDDNPYETEVCQPAVAEVLGACSEDGALCRTDEDCTAADSGTTPTCEGYSAAIAADTHAGSCVGPDEAVADATYTCNSAGSGYGDLACACDTEIARWITTYHREGRWVHDISPMLPMLAKGGHQRLRFQGGNAYELTGTLRFSNAGKSAKPARVLYVLDPNNPDTFEIPSTAKKVELATVISQHGQTCGEFCNAEHHFVINDNSSVEIVRDFPTSSTTSGCMEQVDEGTVPNQYGTWWYGRSGWCPGKQVETVVDDITSQVVIGGENTISYTVEGDAGSVLRRFWILISE